MLTFRISLDVKEYINFDHFRNKMLLHLGVLWAYLVFCCHGLPSEEELLSMIDKSAVQNALKRGVDNLFARNVDAAVGSCPFMMNQFHGKRSSLEQKRDNTANDLISAAQAFLHNGHSIEDLQSENVKRVFERQTSNCPSVPDCSQASTWAYRTIDGSCNNLENPSWGQAGTPQIRIVDAAYDDGISNPRTKSVTGADLPSPRAVSNEVHAAPRGREIREKDLTLHAFQMGQFVSHDIYATPTQSAVKDCCSSMSSTDVGNCFPIMIDGSDEVFSSENSDYCMNFQRSAGVFCPSFSSIREQRNDITSFVDASSTYGSSEAELVALRDGAKKVQAMLSAPTAMIANIENTHINTEPQVKRENTFLKMEEEGNRLPNNPVEKACISNKEDGIYCSLAGDFRVNVVPSLLTYHALFAREHNRIAQVLRPFYSDDEILFQETRKIVIAETQKIVYDEFLPAFLSAGTMDKYKLNSSYDFSYDASIDPTASNDFGIAFRFGHSWIPRQMDIFRKDFTPFLKVATEDTYFRPDLTYVSKSAANPKSVDGMEGLAYWLSAVASPGTDRFLEDATRNHLFEDDNGKAFDLAALNIQRGRDHGLPSYNEYRKFCGLAEVPSTWRTASPENGGLVDHQPKVARLLKNVYASPLDIDLFTGILTESHVAGSNVGPTLDCLIGDQFQKLKYGDRYWYQGDVNGYTSEQQAEIQVSSMARILCDNFDFDQVHLNAFVIDKLTSCDDIPSMDLTKFAPPTSVNTEERSHSSNHDMSIDAEEILNKLLNELNQE